MSAAFVGRLVFLKESDLGHLEKDYYSIYMAATARMAGWLEDWSRHHEARAKLARDAAGQLRGAGGWA
jgi:hypothetical protein